MKGTENSDRRGAHMPSSSGTALVPCRVVTLISSRYCSSWAELIISPLENTDGRYLPSAAFILMGKTGVGKSSFIKLLGGTNVDTGEEPDVSSGTKSCTLKPTAYHSVFNNTRIILIDTPGFDDSARDNIELLHDIVSHLWYLARNRERFPLHGIIFLHDISEMRFTGSQQKTLSVLRDICGERCMRNVIIGTTMWDDRPKKFVVQKEREDEMMKNYWDGIHSTARLFEDDQNAAVSIINTLLLMPPVLLLVQGEMLQPPHAIGDTTVGREMIGKGTEEFERLKKTGKTEEAGILETLLKNIKKPADMTLAEKFGLAIAAPIVLAPAAFVAAPIGVIYALVHVVDKVADWMK